MNLRDIGDFIATVGFPGFVAIFVLVRLEPSIRKLRDAITSLMVVTAKGNGMKGEEVADSIKLVADKSHHRRIEDKVDAASGVDSQDKIES